jgi:threonine synthase
MTHTAGPAPHAGVLARYGDLLPLTDRTPNLTLGEGDTPLIDAPSLARWVGVARLLCKYEGLNPTGSFKDRGMVVAVAKAAEEGARILLCASTGNTAASAAAYAARAGLVAVVMVPAGGVALGKLLQAHVYGARILEIEAGFDGVLDLAQAVATTHTVALVNSVNPYRIEGQASGAYEIQDAVEETPDVVALPLGNGGNITAYWRGFTRYVERGRAAGTPRMLGVQAVGADPLVLGRPIPEPRTVASAIRIGRPATWDPALAAARESGGRIVSVEDERILEAQRELARREGVFCEPASAAPLAGLKAAVADGWLAPGSTCVAVLTGHGLKDPEAAAGPAWREGIERVAANEAAVREALLGGGG